jgi:hypothetical protein
LKDIADRRLDRDRELLDVRSQDIASVRKTGASNYLDRFSREPEGIVPGAELGRRFLARLQGLPDHSVSRLWYIGHASSDSLMLKPIHNSNRAVALRENSR